MMKRRAAGVSRVLDPALSRDPYAPRQSLLRRMGDGSRPAADGDGVVILLLRPKQQTKTAGFRPPICVYECPGQARA